MAKSQVADLLAPMPVTNIWRICNRFRHVVDKHFEISVYRTCKFEPAILHRRQVLICVSILQVNEKIGEAGNESAYRVTHEGKTSRPLRREAQFEHPPIIGALKYAMSMQMDVVEHDEFTCRVLFEQSS